VHRYLSGLRDRILADGGIGPVWSDAAAEDREVMAKEDWLEARRNIIEEALRQGAEGWADESVAIMGPWDFDLSEVTAHVDWWHGANDRTVPVSAARRAAACLVDCDLHIVPGRGHLVGQEPVLQTLLGL
jgi:pimeloyl-ACP methyl ester carboxylesterase